MNQRHQHPQKPLKQYKKDIARNRSISQQEERDLALRIKCGDIFARNRLVQTHLKFVISIARKYHDAGLPMADLISAGNLGLIKAAERFDIDMGSKFTTYAIWWVREAIHTALFNDVGTVRMPASRQRLRSRIRRFSNTQRQRGLPEPQIAEIAERFGVSFELVQDVLVRGRKTISFDMPIDVHSDRPMLDQYVDINQKLPDAQVAERGLKDGVRALLLCLSSREREVLNLYFGLKDDRRWTLEEIGLQLGVTKERIRQIKEKALDKLRHSCDVNILGHR